MFYKGQIVYLEAIQRTTSDRWLRAVVGAYNCTPTLEQLRKIKAIFR